MLIVVILNRVIMSIILLSVIMLSDAMLNAVSHGVCDFTGNHCAKCCYDDCEVLSC